MNFTPPLETAVGLLPEIPPPAFRAPMRYLGEDLGSSLSDLPPRHVEAIGALYRQLLVMLAEAQTRLADPQGILEFVDRVKSEQWSAACVATARQFQDEPSAFGAHLSPQNQARLLKNLHDIRGGALTALIMALDWLMLLGKSELEPQQLQSIFFLLRDHLKIMRNCFKDLDEARRYKDLSENPHSTDLIREKWQAFRSQEFEVQFVGSCSGAIASCCMEFSTIDRLIYNLVNNALRHGIGKSLRVYMLPDRLPVPSNLLLAVENEIDPLHAERLRRKFPENFTSLFRGGFTTNGTGLGLRICVDCVGRAHGIPGIQTLIKNHYLGARLTDTSFLAWFFWPAV